MKLLRLLDLQASNTGGLSFTLNEPLELHADSQVALQECVIDVQSTDVIVDATNQTINFSTQGANTAPQIATLTPGVYTLAELAREVARALNAGLDMSAGTGSANGIQWQATFIANKIEISFDRNDPIIFSERNNVGCTMDADEQVMTKATATSANFDAWSISKQVLTKGSGFYCLEVTKITPALTSTNALGLIATPIAPPVGILDLTALEKCIYVAQADSHYFVQDGGGAFTDTGVVAEVGDLYGFRVNAGEIEIMYVRGNTIVTFAAFPAAAYDQSIPYFPILAMSGDQNEQSTIGDGLFHSVDPFDAPPVQLGAKSRTAITLHFENPASYGAAELLGFDQKLQRIDRSSGTFAAASATSSTPKNLSLNVLLDSLPSIQAFDSATGGRRPILATLSTPQIVDTKILYQPSNLVWLDIANPRPISLSTFRIRVVDTGNVALDLADGCSFTLLFK